MGFALSKKKLNKEWHQKNVLGSNQPLEKRINWHIEHEKYCNCRAMPISIKNEIMKRKMD